MRTHTRLLIATSLALTLAACGKKDDAAAPAASEAAASEAAAPQAQATVAPGVYEVTDASGKNLGTTTINADGTYADDGADGTRVAGIVKMVDGKTCFDPSGKAEAECYTDSAPAADGSFTATDAKGAVVNVKPKAK